MAVLKKFCLFTHTKLFIILLFAIFFTFIFPFEAQQCCAWTVLGTSNMSCFTSLKLLNVYKWILVFIYFLAIDTCCVKGWKVAHRILLAKRMGLLLLLCSFPTLFVWVWVVLFFVVAFLLFTCSFLVLLGLHCLVIYYCLLVFYLFISLIVVWISEFFVSLTNFFATIHLFLEYIY